MIILLLWRCSRWITWKDCPVWPIPKRCSSCRCSANSAAFRSAPTPLPHWPVVNNSSSNNSLPPRRRRPLTATWVLGPVFTLSDLIPYVDRSISIFGQRKLNYIQQFEKRKTNTEYCCRCVLNDISRGVVCLLFGTTVLMPGHGAKFCETRGKPNWKGG